ncbi:MAG: response regulator transcription factor [Methylomicrobium sp.]|nr:response regulator transcription factor [Methylomicrobium sp.]
MKTDPPFHNGTVMIVDDTPGNLAMLSDLLSEAGYRVLVATDGVSAIEQIGFLKPDIILLDVMMPGIDGFETCQRLKADPATGDIPLLFMTGLTELEHLLRGFEEGGLDYIVKPVRPPEVLARIEVHLNQARQMLQVRMALNHSAVSVVTVNTTGEITWMTEAAKTLLQSFSEEHAESEQNDFAYALPSPIHDWIMQTIKHFVTTGPDQAGTDFAYKGIVLTMMPCEHSAEYLLFLSKRQETWDMEALRESLGLTGREAEILMWISRGKTNKEVGIILGSSPRTVNKHLEHIFEKLGVSTRAAAVAKAFQSG